MNTVMRRASGLFLTACCILLASGLIGCAAHQMRTSRDFIAVIANPGDTYASLAEKYLNDPAKDWVIAEFNGASSLAPGQAVVIPLHPIEKGGLTTKRYQTVPVLCYNRLSQKDGDRKAVSRAVFEKQMELIKEKGYRVVSMDQFFDFLDFNAPLPGKSVVITAEDDWRSFYDIAFPVLKKFGYKATLFIATDSISDSRTPLPWKLIKEMAGGGIDIQCRSKTLGLLNRPGKGNTLKEGFDEANEELSLASKIIKERLGKDLKYLAHPHSELNHLAVALLKKHGFRGAFAVKHESNPFFNHNYQVYRSMVSGDSHLGRFEQNLTFSSTEVMK